MTPYGVVISLLLVTPWAFVGVMAVGAALARLQHGGRDERAETRSAGSARGEAVVAGGAASLASRPG